MVNSQDLVRLYPNKGKTFRSAGFALAMAAGMILLVIFRTQADVPIWATLLLVASAFLLTSSAVHSLKILFSKQPVLEMDSEGFSEKTTFASADRILWSEIIGIQIGTQTNVLWAMIAVDNPSELFERQKSSFTKFFMRLNRFTDKGFFRVAVSELPIPPEDFVTMFVDYLDRYGKKQN